MLRGFLKVFLCTLMAAACMQVSAQALRVGSVADSRFGDSWTLNGPEMTNTRAKLLNPLNFGPTGIASRSITIIDTAATVGSVDATLLSGFDVFFIGYLDDANVNAFTAAELNAMQAWVNGGGTMIVTCDDDAHDAVCAFFGHPSSAGSPGVNPTVPTAAGAASPIFNGPFGVVTSINEEGTQGAFTSTTGATVLATDSTPGTPLPDVLIQQFGSGRVIFLADVDMIANAETSGGGIGDSNDRFLGNLFAFVAGAGSGAVGPVPTLSPAGLALLSLLLVCAAAILWRRRGGLA
jgi:IPTL-CTERM motif